MLAVVVSLSVVISGTPGSAVIVAAQRPAAILARVRDRTYWVPYRGALRGPVGVLMDLGKPRR